MTKKRICMEEGKTPKGIGSVQSVGCPEPKGPPRNISSQHLEPTTDLERLVDEGLTNTKKLKHIINNTSTIKFLDYAEERIQKCFQLKTEDKTELLELIEKNKIRIIN